MRPALSFLLLLSVVSSALPAQDKQAPTLHLGDPAPPLRLREWLKGAPIQSLEKGRVYVLEFWAVWCAPCRAAIPRISVLAEKYSGKVTFLGIDVLEQGINSLEKVKAFVESMGNRMNYAVAAEDSNYMATTWQKASGYTGVPTSFVVNAEGKLAWIGHPMYLHAILPRILKNKWDIQKAQAKRKLDLYLDSLDEEAYYRLLIYRENFQKPADPAKSELALIAIKSILINEPRLKYAPRIAYQTFAELLKTNPQEAYKYGKAAIVTPTYQEPAFDAIIAAIETYSERLQLPPEIYVLGAEAWQKQIDWIPYPENADMHKYYSIMADWYSRGGKKSKAKEAREKAIKVLKSKKDYSSK